jgi:crotonobetainyl-CoA:carnitine CoA-transferase CaiB-like acyl-CoA transferase
MSSSIKPLSGVTVLEIAHYIAGPYAAQILGDQGARVVKIEPPGGERGRRAMPYAEDGESLYYACYNRDKVHVCLDLRTAEGIEQLAALIRQADVLLTNYALGVPEKLGFGWEQVRSINPGCSMIQISGFGSNGPFTDYAAFDGVAQAVSGLADMVGSPDGPPMINNVLVADHSTAAQAAMGALLALHKRDRGGEGSYLEVSMLRSLASMFGDWIPQVTELERDPHRSGGRSRLRFGNTYPTSDGYLLLAPITADMWCDLCRLIGHEEWADPAIHTERRNVLDEGLRTAAEEAVRDWLADQTSVEAERRLQAKGIACGAMRTVREIVQLDRDHELGMLRRVRLVSGGEVSVFGSVFAWDCEEPTVVAVTGVGTGNDVLEPLA